MAIAAAAVASSSQHKAHPDPCRNKRRTFLSIPRWHIVIRINSQVKKGDLILFFLQRLYCVCKRVCVCARVAALPQEEYKGES